MPPSGKAFSFTTVGTVLVEWQGATRLGEIVQRYFRPGESYWSPTPAW